jgi:hypothetical protein
LEISRKTKPVTGPAALDIPDPADDQGVTDGHDKPRFHVLDEPPSTDQDRKKPRTSPDKAMVAAAIILPAEIKMLAATGAN